MLILSTPKVEPAINIMQIAARLRGTGANLLSRVARGVNAARNAQGNVFQRVGAGIRAASSNSPQTA